MYDYGTDEYGKGTVMTIPYFAFGRELSKRVPGVDAVDAAQDLLFGREEYDPHATKVRVSHLLDSKDWFWAGDDINTEAIYDESVYSLAMSIDGMILVIGVMYNAGNVTDLGYVRVFAWDSEATNYV